jgi:hypothetical protein
MQHPAHSAITQVLNVLALPGSICIHRHCLSSVLAAATP